ncbi:DNA endonuclease [Sporosarcina sp. Marseille-Q4943]|uniref:DNA endonuclease n=1 Tax=Sporosarcina sp. Marseille-Q4943 TaxID=2942204 RepID=UPI00208DC2EA|nr:DNA endonuclease [Sporosarcina sp. Marseille-Q4943]
MYLYNELLSPIQSNVLFASILGDGTLTKISGKSRRVNSNYREHFSHAQLEYRQWKISFLQDLFYLNNGKNEVLSKSQPLFTELEQIFYEDRAKRIPMEIIKMCTLPHFLAVLYMDDGSLSITSRVNHRLKKIYLTPHIYLYLQSFTKTDLQLLRDHIREHFNVNLAMSRRKDGSGYVLKTTTVKATFNFFQAIRPVILSCPSMYYKTNWDFRFNKEMNEWAAKFPDYDVIASSNDRSKTYSEEDIELLIRLKLIGYRDKDIAELLQRSYWSVVYKWREINKESVEVIKSIA